MRKFCLYLFLLCTFSEANAQIQRYIDSVSAKLSHQTAPGEKIRLYGKIAEAYFLFKQDDSAYHALNMQFQIADLNNDPALMRMVVLDDAISSIGSSATKETYEHILAMLRKEIRYAQNNGESDLLVLAYGRLSEVLLKRGNLDEALSAAIDAITQSAYVRSDSIRARAYIYLANVYMEKDEAVSASVDLNVAFDLSLKNNDQALQSLIYHRIAEIYFRLGQPDEAVAEVKKSLSQNQHIHNLEGITSDYFDLARFTDEKYFITETIRLADSLHLLNYLVNAKRLMLAWYQVVQKDSRAALNYLKKERDLRTSYLNSGIDNFYTVIGNIFFYGGHGDSAVYYYELAGPSAITKYDETDLRVYYRQLADAYAMAGHTSRSIDTYEKALILSKRSDNKMAIAEISQSLGGEYEKEHNYRQALFYTRSYIRYEDTLKKLSREKDLALLGVVREAKRHEQERQQLTAKENSQKNLQYASISISIVIAFFIMLVIGSFSISRQMIRFMGFLFFISLFEFIVMLIDNLFIDHTIHNQPMKLWLIKIALVIVLVPLQHFLEHRVGSLLESRKLISARLATPRQIWRKMKYSPKPVNQEEDDPSVL